MIYVNEDKLARAREILSLIAGERHPIDERELERQNRFSKHLAEAKIDPKKTEEAVAFIYGKLGGLVRSEEEQKAFDVKVAPLKNRSRAKKKDD